MAKTLLSFAEFGMEHIAIKEWAGPYGTRKLSQPGSTAIKFPEQRRDKVSTELGKISDRGE